jgi:hypothetical protein
MTEPTKEEKEEIEKLIETSKEIMILLASKKINIMFGMGILIHTIVNQCIGQGIIYEDFEKIVVKLTKNYEEDWPIG